MFRNSIETELLEIQKDDLGRFLSVRVKIGSQILKLVNLYAPNDDDAQYFAKILSTVSEGQNDHILVGGDFNTVLDIEKDKVGRQKKPSKSSQLLNAFMEDQEWIDIWRHYNTDSFQYTWRRAKPLIMTRLDYFIAPIATVNLIENCKILPAVVSDHCAVALTLSTQTNLRGPGYWKLNVKTIQNKKCVDEVNNVFKLRDNRYKNLNPLNKLERIKEDIKATIIEHARNDARTKKEKKNNLNNKLRTLRKKLNCINVQADNTIQLITKINSKIDEVTRQLDKELLYETQGAILRATSRWVSQSEHSSKYFFGLEKWNAKNKCMSQTIDEAGNLTKNQGSILKIQSKFY